MGVYSTLDRLEVAAFLARYGVGPLEGFEAIAEGIENTNYRVRAGGRRFVLTLFERDPRDAVAETFRLTAVLAARGVPCPAPLAAVDSGEPLGELRGKPAALVPFVEGDLLRAPSLDHLEALGRSLALLHLAGADVALWRGGAHLGETLVPLAQALAEKVRGADRALADLLASEAEVQRDVPEAELPGGVIHSDLFLDNVLFTPGQPEVRAFLDFHLAGRGPWLFDLAVVLGDAGWGVGGVVGERARAILGGYRAVRETEPREFALLPAYLRRATLRFLCLRIERFLLSGVPLASGLAKNPAELAARLSALREHRL